MTKEEIKRIRIQAGLTQSEFGVKIGKSLRTVQNYEDGETVPNAIGIKAIKSLDVQKNVSNKSSGDYGKFKGSLDLDFDKMDDDDIVSLTVFIDKNLESLKEHRVFALLYNRIKSEIRSELYLEISEEVDRDTAFKKDENIKRILKERGISDKESKS